MPAVEMTSSFTPFLRFREQLGFVPNLFLAQRASDRSLEAQALIVDAVWFRDGALSRMEREGLLAAAAGALGNGYAAGIHVQMLMLHGLGEASAHALATDFRAAGLSGKDQALLQFVVKAAARGEALYQGDFDALAEAGWSGEATAEALAVAALAGLLAMLARALEPRPEFGFQPPANVPSLDELCGDGALSASRAASPPVLRSDIELALEGACRDMAIEDSELPLTARLPEWSEEAWIEAVSASALGCFRRILATGLAAAKIVHPAASESRPPLIDGEPAGFADPDAALVAAARQGDTIAFEQLVHLHGRRVYRTVAGILGDAEEARDAMQDTFLKAFDRLRGFEGRSKFSTWLISIAVNGALQRLRERRPTDSLDEANDEQDANFRPRQAQAWDDSPEQRYAKLELRELVQREVRKLPAKYRTAVVLRDIEQLSTEEAAVVMGLGIPTLKSRLLRGRLLLREALSPYFAGEAAAGPAGGAQ